MSNHTLKRIARELEHRVSEYQRTKSVIERRPLSFVEASREFARTAITKDDNVSEGLRRIGKNWRFKL